MSEIPLTEILASWMDELAANIRHDQSPPGSLVERIHMAAVVHGQGELVTPEASILAGYRHCLTLLAGEIRGGR